MKTIILLLWMQGGAWIAPVEIERFTSLQACQMRADEMYKPNVQLAMCEVRRDY